MSTESPAAGRSSAPSETSRDDGPHPRAITISANSTRLISTSDSSGLPPSRARLDEIEEHVVGHSGRVFEIEPTTERFVGGSRLAKRTQLKPRAQDPVKPVFQRDVHRGGRHPLPEALPCVLDGRPFEVAVNTQPPLLAAFIPFPAPKRHVAARMRDRCNESRTRAQNRVHASQDRGHVRHVL